MANNLQPKTLAKISYSANRLIPLDKSLVNDEMKTSIKKFSNRAMPKEIIEEKITIAKDFHYKFVAKGLATKRIQAILADREVSLKTDKEVYESLIKVCRKFDENELTEMNYLKVTFDRTV